MIYIEFIEDEDGRGVNLVLRGMPEEACPAGTEINRELCKSLGLTDLQIYAMVCMSALNDNVKYIKYKVRQVTTDPERDEKGLKRW